MTRDEQKTADEQDALMDTIKMDDFEPEPNHYQDELTRARELLKATAQELRAACRNAVWQDVILAAERIEKELEGER